MHAIHCLLIALVLASTWEYCVHRFILHATAKESNLWRRYGKTGLALREARFNHLIHHKLVNPSTWTQKRLRLSGLISPESISDLEQTGFGEFVNPSIESFMLLSAVPMLVTVTLYLLEAPEQLPIGILIGMLPYILSSWTHPYLHDAEAAAEADERGVPNATLRRKIVIKLMVPLRNYHAVHHKYPWTNFNLLLGADQLVSLFALAGKLAGRNQAI